MSSVRLSRDVKEESRCLQYMGWNASKQQGMMVPELVSVLGTQSWILGVPVLMGAHPSIASPTSADA